MLATILKLSSLAFLQIFIFPDKAFVLVWGGGG